MPQYDLRVSTKSVHYVDAFDLDDIVNANIPAADNYEFVAAEESSNGSAQTYNNVNGELDELMEKAIQIGKLDFEGHSVLNYLVREQVIPPGDYVVEVFW